MAIYRSNRPHHVLSRQEKLDLFRDCTVFLFGPTGVGKTTLLRQIMKVMVSEKTARLERDPNYLPVATVEARAPELGSFDWKVYYQSVLASLAESPTSDYSIPNRSKLRKSKPHQGNINIGSKNSHLFTLREQVIVNMRHRELIVFLTDEAQRFSKLASSSRQQIQMDALQSMASMTNTLHGLFGTYELLEFRNLSGQLSRRSIDIHFPRYQADCSSDLIEFQRVLKSFGEKMTLEKAPELEIHWEYFYERSIGCVGILKDWLTQAYRKALQEEVSTLRERHWQPYAPSISKCIQIAAEAIEGEKAFQFESGELSLLRQKLGLSGASSSITSSENLPVTATSRKKTKSRPGVRQPSRDVIGET